MLGTAGTLVVLLALAGPSTAVDAARHVLERERCQTELPLAETAPSGGASRRPGAPSAEVEGDVAPPPIRIPLPSSLLAAVAVAIVVASALAFLLHRLPGRSGLPLPDVPAARPARARPARAGSGDDPERLAAQGRFAEAIHALLLRALAGLEEYAAKPALTSREVLRGSRLGRDARSALGVLVSAVERAHFGRKAAGPAEYEACLAEFRRLRSEWPARP